ncbi:MAG TPA: hypothetical protein VGR78_09735, partial [Verrucomicrobiae bacterium]|nr:hypothetical protein [Verrucomicrobiae bacterium]
MKLHLNKWFCAATLAVGLSTPIRAEDHEPHHKMNVGDEMLVTATATVQDLDLEKRELTLKGPLGDVSTITVDKSVKRLDEIKPGDQVTAKYYLSIAAELREPTDEEKEHPIMIVEGTAKAPKDASPA